MGQSELNEACGKMWRIFINVRPMLTPDSVFVYSSSFEDTPPSTQCLFGSFRAPDFFCLLHGELKRNCIGLHTAA